MLNGKRIRKVMLGMGALTLLGYFMFQNNVLGIKDEYTRRFKSPAEQTMYFLDSGNHNELKKAAEKEKSRLVSEIQKLDSLCNRTNVSGDIFGACNFLKNFYMKDLNERLSGYQLIIDYVDEKLKST